MRSRRPAEAFTVKSSGGSQQRSTWQSAEINSYRIARERSSADLARQAPRGRRAGSGCGRYGAGDRARVAAGARRGARDSYRSEALSWPRISPPVEANDWTLSYTAP